MFKRAWQLLQEEIEGKTSWGRNELKTAMARCLQQAVEEMEE